jgi:hypothetical protein
MPIMAAHVLLPWIHRVFANTQRWALGVCHGLRQRRPQRHLDELVFRFNRRHAPAAAMPRPPPCPGRRHAPAAAMPRPPPPPACPASAPPSSPPPARCGSAGVNGISRSLRNVNLIGFIEHKTRLFRWALTGHWIRQHDPDLLPNGNILLFDNRGGSPERGGSRILEIEPATQRIVWRFEGVDGDRFDSETEGEQEPLPGGNVLIAETDGGRAIEVTRDEPPRIVWEYVNLRERTESGGIVERVVHARRYQRDALPFLSAP